MKRFAGAPIQDLTFQPPSGGCVLKPSGTRIPANGSGPAAFGRLCVET